MGVRAVKRGGGYGEESGDAGGAQCYNSAEKQARMGNFDSFSTDICGCNCVHKCLGSMKQAMEKFIDVFRSGKHTAKSDDFQRKPLACECENNCLLSIPAYRERK